MKNIEYRTFGTELRAEDDNRHVSGYGVVFNSDSQPLYIWDENRGIVEVVEQITSESIREADMEDVISAYNHNFDKVMGRTTSGTLEIRIDEKGVFYRAKAPKTTYGDDVLELVRRGDLRGSSFVFTMDYEEGYDIKERADGTLLAIPKRINRIYEMGPVINPAYPETTAENRTSELEKAIKRHLEAQKTESREEAPEKSEQRTEEADNGPDDVTDDASGDGPDDGMQEEKPQPEKRNRRKIKRYKAKVLRHK